MKKNLSLLVLLLSTALFAQDFDLGKVSVEELSEKKHPSEPSAPAAILYRKGVTSFDIDSQGYWNVITDVMVRLKVYNKEGYDYATVKVPFYAVGKYREEVVFDYVATYNLEGGKVVKTKLEKESEFVEDFNDKWKIKKIVLPNVKEGSVIEYHYKIKSSNITSFPDWYFQYEIPVKNISYEVRIPQYFTYNRIFNSYLPIKEDKGTEKRVMNYSNSYAKGGYGITSSVLPTETGRRAFYEIVRNYSIQDVPSLKNEAYVDNIDNYRSIVKHELAVTQLPGEPEKKYSSDWNSVVKSVYDNENFGGELNQKSYFEDDLDFILQGKTQRQEIIDAVFTFIKNKMTWNEQYGYSCVKGVKRAYADKTGNVAEINLMLIAMLRYAGITANPILLSTRSNGHASFVNRDEFNYVIAGVEAQKGIVYLDATSKNAMLGILPIRDLNVSGRVIRENKTSEEVSLIPEKMSREGATVIAAIDGNGNVTGQVKSQYYDYNAYMYRENYSGVSASTNLKRMQKRTGAEINDLNVESDDFSKPVTVDYTFNSNTIADVIDNKIYLPPMLNHTLTESPFKDDKRTYPVDFVFPQQERYVLNITIPDGYTVESLPKPVVFATRDNIAEFKFNIAANQSNQIQIIVTKDINKARISPDYYDTLKEFYTNMIKKQGEKIVLVKK